MKGRGLLLRLLIALNGVDAGTTLVVFAMGGPSVELNPIMRACLVASPFFFLFVKLAIVDLMVVWMAKKPGAMAGIAVATAAYAALVLFQLHMLFP